MVATCVSVLLTSRYAFFVRRLIRTLRLCAHASGRFLDGAVRLAVPSLRPLRRVFIDGDVWIDAVALSEPLAFDVEHPEGRHRDTAAVGERRRSADADEAAPGASADERTKSGLTEVEGKRVASRSAPAV